MPEKCNCPICGIAATMTVVWNKLDSRIECPRCKVFDIDHRAEVNLANSNRAPNWAILSGRTREHWEWQRGDDLPRLVWKEVEGDRGGKYIIEGQNVERLSSQLKAEKLFQHLSRKTDRTAGEPLLLRNPIDLSLAYARSIDEFVAILSFLQDRALVQFDRLDEDTFQLSMTIQGADRDSSVEKEDDSNEILPRADVEIVGPSIDSGAFGTIYPGLQLSLNRPVAVKIIKANAKPDAIDHARGLARVKHANVVAVYDVGSVIDPVTGELVDCVVMELLEGKKLFEIWKELDEAKACKLCEQILDGVSAIHAAGICHHDLHAGNIMVCEEDVKIIDIQYTESARLSNLRTQSRAELQRDDCKAVAGTLRSVYWHANKDRLPPLEELFSNISDIKSIEILLNHLTSDTSLSNQIDSVEPSIDGLNEDDLTVLKLAGQQVTECDRFPGRISVPQITEAMGDINAVAASIRMMTELGYFHDTNHAVPRYLMITTMGFDQYLSSFRTEYESEYRRICINIIRAERTRDIEIAATTEIPRPIVEHVIEVLRSNGLIESTRYNSETSVYSVSERLKRQYAGI